VVAHPPSAALSRALKAALVAVLAALYARGFVLEIRELASGSMSPTLIQGDLLVVDRLIYAARDLPPALRALLPAREPRRGDLLVLSSPEDGRTVLVKRCVALAGDPVEAGTVPPSTLWVEGDDRTRSYDSRAFGPVERRALIGRGVLVVASKGPGGGWRWERTLRGVR